MVAFGGGMFLFAPLRLAVLESLLPNGSSQLGPPLCFRKINEFQIKHMDNVFMCVLNGNISNKRSNNVC